MTKFHCITIFTDIKKIFSAHVTIMIIFNTFLIQAPIIIIVSVTRDLIGRHLWLTIDDWMLSRLCDIFKEKRGESKLYNTGD